jgi:Enoyl-(Acyl carrier protein) reductase
MSIQSLKRFVDPKDIAALALFLASDAGKSISGQMLPIDNDSLKPSLSAVSRDQPPKKQKHHERKESPRPFDRCLEARLV